MTFYVASDCVRPLPFNTEAEAERYAALILPQSKQVVVYEIADEDTGGR